MPPDSKLRCGVTLPRAGVLSFCQASGAPSALSLSALSIAARKSRLSSGLKRETGEENQKRDDHRYQ